MIEQTKLVSEKLKYSCEYGLNFDDRTIQIFGELDEDIGAGLRIKFEVLKQWYALVEEKKIEDITLDISSYGGSIYAIFGALDFYYELKTKGILVNTRAHSICMSAATVLLAGGTGQRSSLPNCRFMLHDVQIEGVGGTANQVQHTAKTISDEQMELFSMYANFSRKGLDPLKEKELIREAKKWHKKYTKDGFDHYLNPIDLKELNLIDEIL